MGSGALYDLNTQCEPESNTSLTIAKRSDTPSNVEKVVRYDSTGQSYVDPYSQYRNPYTFINADFDPTWVVADLTIRDTYSTLDNDTFLSVCDVVAVPHFLRLVYLEWLGTCFGGKSTIVKQKVDTLGVRFRHPWTRSGRLLPINQNTIFSWGPYSHDRGDLDGST